VSRFLNELFAIPIDAVGVFFFVLIVLGAATVIALLWHYFPRWIPRLPRLRDRARSRERKRRRPRWRLPRFRRRRRAIETVDLPERTYAADALPETTADLLRAAADRYAAEGRYAEAVRERLRAIVRELVTARVIAHHPDWTVVELARAAATADPTLGPALATATTTFSDIWYGERPARAEADAAMRSCDETVRGIVTTTTAAR
jgi:hypothetical protein